ncbi:MAG: hypothetical protein PHS33_07865, partial [Candidatus Omnitrophica bacterium]|nr:hypothetical protein [Candidatus Omnitrophota bacterium]
MKYRFLKDGEAVNVNSDQQRNLRFDNKWKQLSVNTLWHQGEIYHSSMHNPIRRPLKSKVISKPSSNKRSTVRKPQPKLAKRKLRAAQSV